MPFPERVQEQVTLVPLCRAPSAGERRSDAPRAHLAPGWCWCNNDADDLKWMRTKAGMWRRGGIIQNEMLRSTLMCYCFN